MIIDASFEDGIQVREYLMDFIRYLCNHSNLLRVSQTGKDTGDFV
jgi:hypothetical protein